MFKRRRKRNRWRQWSIDRPSCIDSPRSSFLCRRKSGLVCRSPPFASCGDRPRRPGPTVVWCWALLPVRTHTANTKTCAPNTAVTKTTTTVNSSGLQKFCWGHLSGVGGFLSPCYCVTPPCYSQRKTGEFLTTRFTSRLGTVISQNPTLKFRLWFDTPLSDLLNAAGPMVVFRTQQECNQSDLTCWKVKKAIEVWKH